MTTRSLLYSETEPGRPRPGPGGDRPALSPGTLRSSARPIRNNPPHPGVNTSVRGAMAILILLTCSSEAIWSADARFPVTSDAVCWLHALSRAQRLSRETGKPILRVADDPTARIVLAGSFSHPIVVDAANDLFIPLFTTEGAANSAAVRFEDADGNALTPASPAHVTTAALLAQMVTAYAPRIAMSRRICNWLAMSTIPLLRERRGLPLGVTGKGSDRSEIWTGSLPPEQERSERMKSLKLISTRRGWGMPRC